MLEFKLRGKELVIKEVKARGTGAVVYIPRAWVGLKVAVIREPEE